MNKHGDILVATPTLFGASRRKSDEIGQHQQNQEPIQSTVSLDLINEQLAAMDAFFNPKPNISLNLSTEIKTEKQQMEDRDNELEGLLSQLNI